MLFRPFGLENLGRLETIHIFISPENNAKKEEQGSTVNVLRWSRTSVRKYRHALTNVTICGVLNIFAVNYGNLNTSIM